MAKYEKLYDYISKVDKRIDSRSDKLIDHMCREMNVLHDKIDKKEEDTRKKKKTKQEDEEEKEGGIS